MERTLILYGILFVFLGIALGAFAAHGLESMKVDAERIESFKVGVNYLLYSGFGLMILAGIRERFDFEMKLHFRSIFFGTILFSGSIFLLVLLPVMGFAPPKFIGPITPVGGFMMLVGWFTLFVKYLRQISSN
jgi:uncharacterized membrane protein YgdD (TMEM256/DUF423 family)